MIYLGILVIAGNNSTFCFWMSTACGFLHYVTRVSSYDRSLCQIETEQDFWLSTILLLLHHHIGGLCPTGKRTLLSLFSWSKSEWTIVSLGLAPFMIYTVSYFCQEEMQRFVKKIVDLMRAESLFSWQGGPIIMLQVVYKVITFRIFSQLHITCQITECAC